LDGFLFIDKPAGPTSYDIVKYIKPLCRPSKIGHSGTLDPAASGLLIIALGKATRLLEYLPGEPKVYEFFINFGIETDSLDNQGALMRSNGRIPTQSEVEFVLPQVSGKRMQIPPRFSALKIGGERAYTRARNGEEFTLAPRPVEIYELRMLNYLETSGKALCRVSCSKGTYVRSLARDIATTLGTIAHASGIRRIATGPFTLDRAIPFAEVQSAGIGHIVSIKNAFENCCTVTLNQEHIKSLSFGADIRLGISEGGNKPVFAFDGAGEIVAVLLKKSENVFHPEKVFCEINLEKSLMG
jgi:tRNA pseudouridine55 synthase